jgi:hypothetical protein
MENDSIRASGANTLVDVWIDGKLRAISVTRAAIEAFLALPSDKAAAMSDEDRCEFVRTHLSVVLTAAKAQLRQSDPAADSVAIDQGDLGRPASSRGTNRRATERRKAERRKPQRADSPRVPGDRRRGERRRTERRKPPTDR